MESLVSEPMIVWKFALHNALKGKSAKECWLNKAYWVKGLYATWKSLKMAVQLVRAKSMNFGANFVQPKNCKRREANTERPSGLNCTCCGRT